MTENLLQFIWQHRLFNQLNLQTTTGEDLIVLKQGLKNTHQGPDFLQATIQINEIKLIGNVELHLKASDWNKHRHSEDINYSNVILHVVWENDTQVSKGEGVVIPQVVLQDRVPKILLARYEELMNYPHTIACATMIDRFENINWMAWKERLLVERLEIKSKRVLEMFEATHHHWEEVFWRALAANFGIKVNATLFESVAKSISVGILAKHKNQIHQLEALLLGQANLLEGDFEDTYPKMLQKEYRFLQQKYQLAKVFEQPMFLRMRPANFPTIRLAQLAMLVHRSSHLFSVIKEMEDVKELKKLFDITSNDYWDEHYSFDEVSVRKPKHVGNQMVDNVIINTVVPVMFSYAWYHKDELLKEKSINWLRKIAPEQNNITKSWKALDVEHTNAFDSQSLIHLTNNYCKKKLCLSCSVGYKLLQQ